VKEKRAQRQLDGTLELSFLVVNKSTVQARNGSIYIEICQTCEYLEDPPEFHRPAGASPQQRQRKFRELDAATALAVSLRLKTPPLPPGSKLHRIEVGVKSGCENCVFRPKDSLWVAYSTTVK
jgi:hypothetical protein